ncbi:transmembrane protein, putative [Medicago truncatula]|uniref:Transmembrane protein, putative n=1 Tax=Medicago truncatula TaxID=3880 RepID=A0A072UJ38_MEDTR|nr:transmembrane protein, putative [Medicago truncatula]
MAGEKHVPKGTTAMVNMWVITHDEKVCNEAKEFKSQRAHLELVGGFVLEKLWIWLLFIFGLLSYFTTSNGFHNFKWVPCDDSPIDLD